MDPLTSTESIKLNDLVVLLTSKKLKYYRAVKGQAGEWLLHECDATGKRYSEPRKPKKGEHRTRWLLQGNCHHFAKYEVTQLSIFN